VAAGLALGALVDMLAQSQRAAHRQLGQRVLDLRRSLIPVPIQKARRVLPQQVDYAKGGAGPLSGVGGGVGSEFAGGWLLTGVFEGPVEGPA